MANSKNGFRIWTSFWNEARGVIHSERSGRINDKYVWAYVGGSTYRIPFPEESEGRNALVAFDGYLLPDGLSGNAIVLDYERYGDARIMNGDNSQAAKDKKIQQALLQNKWHPLIGITGWCVERENNKAVADETILAPRRYFLSVQKSTGGNRPLVCELSPRSLKTRFVIIEATFKEVRFIAGAHW